MQGKLKNQFTLFGSKPLDAVVAADHPLRKIRAYFDLMWAELAPAFDTSYSSVGRPSLPIEVQLRAQLLRALNSIKSERALCEQIEMNAGFRWFVGLDWDDSVFDHSVLSNNRERLFGNGAAEAFLGEVCRLAETANLMNSDRLVVDGTLIRAWASHKSFQPRDKADFDQGESGNFKGEKPGDTTHASKQGQWPVIPLVTSAGSGTLTFTYDKENRLTVQNTNGVLVTYSYAGDGRKRTEVVGGTTTTIIWDGSEYLGEI